MSNDITLAVNGKEYGGWISVRIEAGIERLARSFELSVTEYWPGSGDKKRQIKPGDLCEIKIGDDLVCTGYVDATPISYDSSAITIMIRGRSKTADLIDCSADSEGGQFKNLPVQDIIKKLASPYGIEIISEVNTGAILTEHQIQPGETVFESVDRLARSKQILISDNAAGDCVLTNPGSGGQSFDGLELGVNILSGNAGFDFTDVYSNYTVKGQQSGRDDGTGLQASQPKGTAIDGSLSRSRLLIIRQSGQADNTVCGERANYEQQIRAAKAGELRYRVAGWRKSDGLLWQSNQTVTITDAIMSLDNATMLISEISYTLDDSGMVSELVVISPLAFATEPQTKAITRSRKKGAKVNKKQKASEWID